MVFLEDPFMKIVNVNFGGGGTFVVVNLQTYGWQDWETDEPSHIPVVREILLRDVTRLTGQWDFYGAAGVRSPDPADTENWPDWPPAPSIVNPFSNAMLDYFYMFSYSRVVTELITPFEGFNLAEMWINNHLFINVDLLKNVPPLEIVGGEPVSESAPMPSVMELYLEVADDVMDLQVIYEYSLTAGWIEGRNYFPVDSRGILPASVFNNAISKQSANFSTLSLPGNDHKPIFKVTIDLDAKTVTAAHVNHPGG